MITAKRIVKDYRESGALHSQIALFGFLDPTTFFTKNGDLGTVLRVGPEARLEVSQIGKICHDRCAIFEQAGDCVMPREGIFARVLAGGRIASGDRVAVESPREDKEKGHA